MRKPNLFIVGAPRCGTTAMNEYLKAHPDIYIPNRKDIHYFDTDNEHATTRSEPQYLELFSGATQESYLGEASVWYLYSAIAAQKIKAISPKARIVIMLRNPMEMLHSLHARLMFHRNEDVASFERAFDLSETRRRGEQVPPSCSLSPRCLVYEDVGRFSPQVQRYLDVFGPERVHVVIYEDFQADTAREYRRLLEFLGIDPSVTTDFKVINPHVDVRLRALQALSDGEGPWVHRLVPKNGKLAKLIWKLNRRPGTRTPLGLAATERMKRALVHDVRSLGTLLGRDLEQFWFGTNPSGSDLGEVGYPDASPPRIKPRQAHEAQIA